YWAFCDGTLLSIAQNSALFSLIGTTYGGNGQTTFALPDFRGRYAIHQGQGPGLPSYDIGEIGGTQSKTLLTTNLPAHNHVITSITGNPGGLDDGGSQSTPGGGVPADLANRYVTTGGDGPMSPSVSLASSPIAGSNQPVSNLSPFLAMNYIICVEGIYPSRN